MIYVLYGIEKELIIEFIVNIKKRENIDNIINYDYEEVNLDEIISDASYNSLFGEKKLIVVNNSFFLQKKEDVSLLEKYINSININTFLVFVLNEEKINNTLKINKLLKEKCVVKEFNEMSIYKLESLLVNKLKEENYTISKEAINELCSRCKNDYSFIVNEIEKLKLYKLDEKSISLEDVISVVSENIENDVFKLTDAIASKDKVKIINVYEQLITNNDPIMLISIIANEFRLYKQTRDLLNLGYTSNMISKELSVHPYRVKLALEKINYFSKADIENILVKLFDLDYKIKKGDIDKFIGFELFLLSF